MIAAGGSIVRAIRRLPWPGEAAVVVSVVHIVCGAGRSPVLDGRQVRRISAYLVEGDLDGSPARLAVNVGKAFKGCWLLGAGFIFDDVAAAKGEAVPVSEMHRLIAKNPHNAERIFPYLGGEVVNTDPHQAHRRWVIDFSDYPLRREPTEPSWASMDVRARAASRAGGILPMDYPAPVAADWPDLLEVVERLVKPVRARDKREAYRRLWWQYCEKRVALRQALIGQTHVLAITQTSPHLAVSRLPNGAIFDQKLVVCPETRPSLFSELQSRLHEVWARSFSATMKDDLSYTPSDCFITFPFPTEDREVAELGVSYRDTRAVVMIARNEGLTRTYNRFHDPDERVSDIQRLRDLHHEMDVAVLRAYGWNDLAQSAAPEFLTEDTEQDHRYQDRLFWPAPFRDEVLARLLALNTDRADDETARGLSSVLATIDAEELEEV